ncbi:uncharacterized protein LOC103714492 [Phoenix dactylifera]|uniref:Uncharacterized protein LOC103714492 n=1 Tax=Phoenix dactylifera TaxID=42345 RepID=A0A8B7CIL1_PHODC|nr:uncharacterized protein LOC103714492 [Phoenix dactylifera]
MDVIQINRPCVLRRTTRSYSPSLVVRDKDSGDRRRREESSPQRSHLSHALQPPLSFPKYPSSQLLSSVATMTLPEKPLLKPFLLLLSLSLLLLLTPSFRRSSSPSAASAAAGGAATPLLRIRPGYNSYEDYIKHQLNKTLNPRLRRVWATRDWDRKVLVFARFFSDMKSRGLLSNNSRALCIGARLGQEVAALRRVGVDDAVGVDLVPSPPLVVAGDFHAQPFPDSSFDFEFSNVFDHALYPDRFVAEIERTLRPGGVAVLHVALHRRGDKYSANDLFGVDGVLGLFKHSDLVHVSNVDGFGLDTEVVLRKKKRPSQQ